ncbi:MAG: DUF1552 domain-containing protein [Acidimicrobiia bacterium]|nr:DUF1552 domain-containing protein [Acidimicrobiia bacterium]
MFITKHVLPRRTFLRGAGVTLALPLLDAMVPALTPQALTAAQPVRRIGFVYLANGCWMARWRPKSDGPLTELSPTLTPLEPFKDRIVVPMGLDHRQAEALGDGNGDHSRASAVYLNGIHPKFTEGPDVRAGKTADQYAADAIGTDTPLRSLELAMEKTYLIGACENGYSCAYLNSISWRTATTPNPIETNPRVVFQRLFGNGGSGEERMQQLQEDRSLLDFVSDGISGLRSRLSPADRVIVGDYLEAVRDIEQRIQAVERQYRSGEAVDVPEPPIGIPESFDEHAKLLLDLLTLAWQADITRVFTFTLGKEQSALPYPEIGVVDAHHAVSHHADDPVKLEKYFKINVYQVQLFSYLLGKLQETADGDGTLLDHSLVLYGGGLSDGNMHDHNDLPLVLAGGGSGTLKGGRAIRYRQGTPMNNLLVSMLDKVGAPAELFGDATEPLDI